MASTDLIVHEQVMRVLLRRLSETDMDSQPPVLAQRIHRRLRELTGVEDPYRAAKDQQNQMALDLLRELKAGVDAAPDPFASAVQLAIAANIIDLGAKTGLTEAEVLSSLQRATNEPIVGDMECFRAAVRQARRILYLADNAGEIVFDRLLIEQFLPERVIVAVRGAPIINDATLTDAQTVGLQEIVEVIDNGSDIPGTVLEDCSQEFQRRFDQADLIIAKGQGNFETLSDEQCNIFFLFKVKCPVIAAQVGLPVGTHVLARSSPLNRNNEAGGHTQADRIAF
jgi:uncharacterized protein with ATP-grasp and redox domains